MNRTRILKIYLWILAIFTAFWWPLSHWFYPDWYHNLMGFESYDYSLVKIIGTCGIIPTLLLFFSALNPFKNREMVVTILIFSACMALTYIFLITAKDFPEQEYFNVILLAINILILSLLYPWKAATNKDTSIVKRRHSE